jgi:hypothetical protein
MLCNRYEPMNLFDLIPQLSQELDQFGVQLDRLLDDDTLFQAVESISKRCPTTPPYPP